MSSALNVITAAFGSLRSVTTAPAWQYDYGQILQIEGLDLPAAFEVHFANSPHSGTATTQIGQNGQVTIPDAYLTSGADVYAWIFLHEGDDDGETEYSIRIPVKDRPMASDTQPDPVEQSAITQAIAALNDAVTRTAEDVISADASATAAAQSATDAQTAAQSAQGSAESAAASASLAVNKAFESNAAAEDAISARNAARNYAVSASESAGDADTSARAAAQAQADAETASQTATTKASEASTSASNAASSASAASASAQAASNSASQAAQSSSAAAGSATTASGAASTATTKASEAAASASAANDAKTAAETAKGKAEDAQAAAEEAQADMEETLADYQNVATEATALEVLAEEENANTLFDFFLRALDNRLDEMVADLPWDSTAQEVCNALNEGNSWLNALINELEVV